MLLVMVSSCTKDNKVEPLFDQSINERASQLKSSYISTLSAPEQGWVGYYNPNPEVGSYTLLLKFEPGGTVLMQSDYNQGANNAEITYRIDKTLKMELVFESHSVLHQIYETDQNSIGGEYVFNIVSVDDTEVVLQSKTDNGYIEAPTELRLRRATTADWDVTPLYQSLDNLEGDGMKSVFRNVLINDVPVASFTFNRSRRNATISYLEGGQLVTVIVPINLTPNGFSFINPLTIGGVTLTSFTYDADTDSYVDAATNAKILYDLVPAVPLPPYSFGAKDNLLNNFLETGKSSVAFNAFYNGFRASLAQNYGLIFRQYYLRWLTRGTSYIDMQIWFPGQDPSSEDPTMVYFLFTYEIKDDGKVYFTLTGATNSSPGLTQILQPLLDVIIGSTKGYYLKDTGNLLNYTNKTVSLINADNPAYEINYLDF